MLAFLEKCAYFDELPSATSLIDGTIAGIFDGIDSFIDDIINDMGLPEFSAGVIADAINSLMNGIGIPGGDQLTDILKKADSA
jgi:hypothetical protein